MSATAQAIDVKQGVSLQIGMVFQLDDCTPIDLTGATIACSFQDALGGNQVSATITPAVATGAAVLSLTLPNGAFYSDSFSLDVTPAITSGGG